MLLFFYYFIFLSFLLNFDYFFLDLYYRAHVQSFGWGQWVKALPATVATEPTAAQANRIDGYAGTMGLHKRLEAIEIVLVHTGNHTYTNYKDAGETYVVNSQGVTELKAAHTAECSVCGKTITIEHRIPTTPEEIAANTVVETVPATTNAHGKEVKYLKCLDNCGYKKLISQEVLHNYVYTTSGNSGHSAKCTLCEASAQSEAHTLDCFRQYDAQLDAGIANLQGMKFVAQCTKCGGKVGEAGISNAMRKAANTTLKTVTIDGTYETLNESAVTDVIPNGVTVVINGSLKALKAPYVLDCSKGGRVVVKPGAVLQNVTIKHEDGSVEATTGTADALKEALKAISGNAEDTVITLTDDVTLANSSATDALKVETGKVTLDLNGHSLKSNAGHRVVEVGLGAELTITGSTGVGITGTDADGDYALVKVEGKLTLDHVDFTSKGGGILVADGGELNIKGGTYTSDDCPIAANAETKKATINIEGATINSKGYAVTTNHTTNGKAIELNMKDCVITSDESWAGSAIYLPAGGSAKLENCTVTGKTALEVVGLTKLDIIGGKYVAKGARDNTPNRVAGSKPDGTPILIVSHKDYEKGKTLNVNISGNVTFEKASSNENAKDVRVYVNNSNQVGISTVNITCPNTVNVEKPENGNGFTVNVKNS